MVPEVVVVLLSMKTTVAVKFTISVGNWLHFVPLIANLYGEIQCTEPVSTCDRDTCLCDKAAVEWFARHWSTTYDSDIDNWKGICDKTSDAPDDDPDRCPSIWNSNVNYPGGSYVSMHGIACRAFYYADRGRSLER